MKPRRDLSLLGRLNEDFQENLAMTHFDVQNTTETEGDEHLVADLARRGPAALPDVAAELLRRATEDGSLIPPFWSWIGTQLSERMKAYRDGDLTLADSFGPPAPRKAGEELIALRTPDKKVRTPEWTVPRDFLVAKLCVVNRARSKREEPKHRLSDALYRIPPEFKSNEPLEERVASHLREVYEIPISANHVLRIRKHFRARLV